MRHFISSLNTRTQVNIMGRKIIHTSSSHGQGSGEKKLHKCQECPRSFHTAQDCTFHEQLHSDGFYSHMIHNTNTNTNNTTTTTTTVSQSNEPEFNCLLCISTFASKRGLKLHNKWRHEGGKQFHDQKYHQTELEYCRFIPNYNLRLDSNTEIGIAKSSQNAATEMTIPFSNSSSSPLNLSIRSVSASTNTNSVVNSPNGERENPQSYSSPGFTAQSHSNSTLKKKKKPERVCKFPKAFKCGYCTRTFTRNASKDEHEKNSHTKILPFRCKFCERAFPARHRLNQHIKRNQICRALEEVD